MDHNAERGWQRGREDALHSCMFVNMYIYIYVYVCVYAHYCKIHVHFVETFPFGPFFDWKQCEDAAFGTPFGWNQRWQHSLESHLGGQLSLHNTLPYDAPSRLKFNLIIYTTDCCKYWSLATACLGVAGATGGGDLFPSVAQLKTVSCPVGNRSHLQMHQFTTTANGRCAVFCFKLIGLAFYCCAISFHFQ